MSIYTIMNPTNQMMDDKILQYSGIQIHMNKNQYEKQECILSFSGIIHNSRTLCHIENIEYEGDETTIIWLYKKYGMDHLLAVVDGIFAFILYDYSVTIMESRVFVARSAIGLIPIYIQSLDSAFLIKTANPMGTGTLLKAGTYLEFMIEFQVSAEWKYMDKRTFYTIPRTLFHDVDEPTSVFDLGIDPGILQRRDACIRQIFRKCGFQDSRLFVLADTNPYSIYMTKQMDLMGISYRIVDLSQIEDFIMGDGNLVVDVRGMTYLSCGSEEPSEIAQDRLCRGLFVGLCDGIATGYKMGHIWYPFLDQLWIEFYMTIRPRLRKRVFNALPF